MGSRGPAPTPTRKLDLRGSWRAGTRPGEPKPEPVAPVKPAALSPAAGAVWDERVRQGGLLSSGRGGTYELPPEPA